MPRRSEMMRSVLYCIQHRLVMAGLVPAIRVFILFASEDVDARNECGHDAN
jgi:hypothetical protein